MLISLAFMLMMGMFMGRLCQKVHLPSLTGMILTGMILGPYALNLIDSSIMDMSADLRKMALIIILIRAGLALNFEDLKKVGRPAILMCFLPACFEVGGMILLAPKLLGVTVLDAAIMGAVVGAVSPAVIVPKMIKIMDEGYGVSKSIPQLILAGASVDDVFVIVLFTALTGLAQGNGLSMKSFVNIPVSIVLGSVIGVASGVALVCLFGQVHMRDTSKVIILLSICFVLVTLEDAISFAIPFSSLIAIMVIGVAIQKKRKTVALRLSAKFNKLWVASEIILFVLVGATVDLQQAASAGIAAIFLVIIVVLFRMIGVFLCLLKTNLTIKEKVFCMFAYTPKATVQAAIGGVPLAMGLACGNTVLTVAVIAILITAPVGAFLIEWSYKKLLIC